MKKKFIYILFIVISFLVISCVSLQAQSLGYEPIDVLDDIEAPLTQQNISHPSTQVISTPQKNTSVAIEKYGAIGVALLTCLSLIGWIIKEDRKTMKEQSQALQDLVAAIADNTSATSRLALTVKSEINELHLNVEHQLDKVETALAQK